MSYKSKKNKCDGGVRYKQTTLSFHSKPPESKETAVKSLETSFPGYDVHNVALDGQCAFSAICHQLIVNNYVSGEMTGDMVRKDVVDFVSNKEELKVTISNRLTDQSIDEYITDMRHKETWADENMLYAASLLYDVEIVVVRNESDSEPTRIGKSNNNRKIILGYTRCVPGENETHYVSLVPSTLTGTEEAAGPCSSPDCEAMSTCSDSDGEDLPVNRQESSTRKPTASSSEGVQLFPFQPRQIHFPARMMGKKKRSFLPKWFDLHPWIEWDPATEAVFCHRCKVARNLGLVRFLHCREEAFTQNGFRNWKHALVKFKEHEQSSVHKESVLKWSAYTNSRNISQQLDKTNAEEQRARRGSLIQLFETLQFLARQGLATRGHTDEAGNYRQLLNLRAKDSPGLARWLNSERYNKWLSHEVEAEMLELLSHSVLRQVLDDIRSHEYFAVIVDETTDISRIEQVSLCIRHVDEQFNILDDFVGLYAIPKTDAATMTAVIKDSLCRLNLPLANLRAQCYDGASNMAGIHSGVQRRIRDEQPKAVYVHCMNHSLNLAIQDASTRVRCIRDTLSFTNELATFFRDSAKRTAVLESVLAAMNENPRSRLHPLCPTRWTVRARALNAVLKNYKAVSESLDELSDESGPTGAKADGLLEKMKTFECFMGIKMCLDVFVVTEQLATLLQNKKMTLSSARANATTVMSTLKELRSENGFRTIWQNISQSASDLQLSSPMMPRKRKPPRRLDDGDTPYDYPNCYTFHRVETWFAFLDTVVNEITLRFSQDCFKAVTDIENVLLRAASGQTVTNELQQIAVLYNDDFNYDTLATQLLILKNLFSSSAPTTLTDIVTTLISAEGASLLLTEVVRLLKLALVIPATSSSAERSFSGLRRLKTHLRSSMGQERLNHLLFLHCHQDRLDNLDLRRVAQEFVSANEKRSQFFGNF